MMRMKKQKKLTYKVWVAAVLASMVLLAEGVHGMDLLIGRIYALEGEKKKAEAAYRELIISERDQFRETSNVFIDSLGGNSEDIVPLKEQVETLKGMRETQDAFSNDLFDGFKNKIKICATQQTIHGLGDGQLGQFKRALFLADAYFEKDPDISAQWKNQIVEGVIPALHKLAEESKLLDVFRTDLSLAKDIEAASLIQIMPAQERERLTNEYVQKKSGTLVPSGDQLAELKVLRDLNDHLFAGNGLGD